MSCPILVKKKLRRVTARMCDSYTDLPERGVKLLRLPFDSRYDAARCYGDR